MEVLFIVVSVFVNSVDWNAEILEYFEDTTHEVRVEGSLMREEDVNRRICVLFKLLEDLRLRKGFLLFSFFGLQHWRPIFRV